ncbi:MAG: hypothetical protein IH987_08690 [Planctomycetes bacterium]|nr:hypothetical protein [Planctomycetota bacterium]
MRRFATILATLLLLLPVVYVLSHAPMWRFQIDRARGTVAKWTVSLPFYRPVEWMIDETPLREPLLRWADLWGVRGRIETDSLLRYRPI